MQSTILFNKTAAFLHRISWRETILLTDKQTCDELRKGLDLSRPEFEKVVEELNRQGYVKIIQDRGFVALKVTEQGKSVAVGNDPFSLCEGGGTDGS